MGRIFGCTCQYLKGSCPASYLILLEFDLLVQGLVGVEVVEAGVGVGVVGVARVD